MKIHELPEWDRLLLHLQLSYYDRDGGHRDPRVRIEFVGNCNQLDWAIKLVAGCARCGQSMNPIRIRESGGAYLAVACPLNISIGCARGSAAAEEYRIIQALIEARTLATEARQCVLF